MSGEEMVVDQESPETQSQATESVQEHNDSSKESQEAAQRKRNDAEYNWAELRRQMKEKDLQIEELRQHFAQATARQTPKEEDDLARLVDDDIITVAQAKKLATRMAKTVAEEVMKQRDAATVDERVSLKFPDYQTVVTKENIELLKQTEPELAQSLYHMPDPYSQAVAAYKLLKKVAVKKEEPNSFEKKKALENLSKPQSINTVTKQSAIGNAHLFENGLTSAVKNQLWQEMQQAMKLG